MKSIDEYKFQTLKCEKCHKCYSKRGSFLKHIDNCNGMIKKNQKPRYDSYPNVSGIGEILHELVSLRKSCIFEESLALWLSKKILYVMKILHVLTLPSKSSKAFDSSASSNVLSNSYDSTYVAKNNDIHIMSHTLKTPIPKRTDTQTHQTHQYQTYQTCQTTITLAFHTFMNELEFCDQKQLQQLFVSENIKTHILGFGKNLFYHINQKAIIYL